MTQTRITRVPFPLDLIRQMDEAVVAGLGGYRTRTELIIDAVTERLLEIGFDDTPSVSSTGTAHRADPVDADPAVESTPPLMAAALTSADPTDTAHPDTPGQSTSSAPLAIAACDGAATIAVADDISEPTGIVLFGLHNRDYPSLWALGRLAAMCVDGPVPLADFWRTILPEAWEHGELLTAFETSTGTKATALFPTNRSKAKAAEAGFRTFAVGEVDDADKNGPVTTDGPLFEWRAAGLTCDENGLLIAPTDAGLELLAACAGTDVVEPHTTDAARAFFGHIGEFAPADRLGFNVVLSAIAEDGTDRKQLLERVTTAWPNWSTSQVSTNSAGYVARAREWGLVEAKQTKGIYRLTDFGRQLHTDNNNTNTNTNG